MEERKQQLLPPDEHRCCQSNGSLGWRCKNFRMGLGAAADHRSVPKTNYCEKHYNYYKNRRKKKTSGDGEGAGSGPDLEKQLPPDEERCCHTDGKGWRCKNFRLSHGAAADDDTVPKTTRCEKHYNYYAEFNKKRKKKTSGDGEDDDTRFIYLISTKKEKILYSGLLQLPAMENKHLSDSRLLCKWPLLLQYAFQGLVVTVFPSQIFLIGVHAWRKILLLVTVLLKV
ncbi:hypothetical protein MKX03_002462 [Papaver bracteatum]|nr:hypothetical protein MKX03_002462 [Papaver bracteatum]